MIGNFGASLTRLSELEEIKVKKNTYVGLAQLFCSIGMSPIATVAHLKRIDAASSRAG